MISLRLSWRASERNIRRETPESNDRRVTTVLLQHTCLNRVANQWANERNCLITTEHDLHTHHFNNYHHHFERTTFFAYISPMEERERERESVRCRNSTNSQNSTNIFVVQSGRPIVWPITRYTPMNGETHTHTVRHCVLVIKLWYNSLPFESQRKTEPI